MAELWDLIVRSNTFNFVVLLAILAVIWNKLNISEKLEFMRQEIADFIEKSKQEKDNAQKQLKTTKKDVEHLSEEINETLEKAKVSAQNVFDEIKQMTKIGIEKIEANVDKIIDNETRKINSKLTIETSQKAIDLAKEKLQKMFDENPQMHNTFIEQSIETLDKVKL